MLHATDVGKRMIELISADAAADPTATSSSVR
jgi:hypothetical protein